MINFPYYQQIKPWPHLKGGVNNMGRLEEPQILLDMLWLALDVPFVAGAGWIPRQLCCTRRAGTGGAGVAGASRRPVLVEGLLERQGKASWKWCRQGQGRAAPWGGSVWASVRLDSGSGKPGIKFTVGSGQDQGRTGG